MTENPVFDSEFHKRYVGGDGDIASKEAPVQPRMGLKKTTEEELLVSYRNYMHEPNIELPDWLKKLLFL